jgi:recombination protein RecA
MPRTTKKQKIEESNKKEDINLAKERDSYLKSLKEQNILGDINKKIDFISTGSWVVNRLIGDGTIDAQKPGGIPRGYFTEICGDEASGKTTLALHIAKQALANNEYVIYADFEQSLRVQSNYVKNILGEYYNSPFFIHITPIDFETGAKNIGNGLIQVRPALIIIDSVAAMLPKDFINSSPEETMTIGKHARMIGNFINFLSKKLPKYNTAVLLINQYRANIKQNKYEMGPNQITTGGKALQYFISLKIRLKKTNNVKEISEKSTITGVSEKKRISQEVKVIIEKNKIDMPWRSGPIYIVFGHGIDNIISLISLGVNMGVIKKSGNTFTWKHPEYGFSITGENALRKHLIENNKVLENLQSKLILQRDTEEIKNRIFNRRRTNRT